MAALVDAIVRVVEAGLVVGAELAPVLDKAGLVSGEGHLLRAVVG